MNLLLAFDDIESNGNKYIFDHLSNEFSSTLVEGNVMDAINIDTKCVFTNSLRVAQEVNGSIPVVLYLNDRFENYSRGNNISSWRNNVASMKNVDSVFVAASYLSSLFVSSYRIPCKVQYPCVPKKDKSNPLKVLFNRDSPHFNEIMHHFSNEAYELYKEESDFQNAKLYIHIPESNEQWNINILLAHTYGVPCITYQQGCLSEFCTGGDKLLPVGSDSRLLFNQFKMALRDQTINSKIVYEMSQRFHSMSDIKQRIKKAFIDNGMHKTPPTFAEVQSTGSQNARMKKLQSRAKPPVENQKIVQKVIRPSRKNDYQNVTHFIEYHNSVYAGVGGLGDAILTLAKALKDPTASIIFGSNGSVTQTIKQLFDVFKIESIIVPNFNGSVEGVNAWNSILDHANFKSAVHIPRNLNYGEWANPEKFLNEIEKDFPTQQLVGKLVNPRSTDKVIGICPRGSDHTSTWKQRYISKSEFLKLVEKCLSENATVIVFGSEEDFNHYGTYQDNNVIFMNSNFAVSHPAPKYPISMRHMLTAINACDEIISVDSWLKTYAALAKIPCRVIMNRYFNKSTMEYADPSDKIFIDEQFWGFKIVTIDSLLDS